jgi:hypothetical protein
MKFLYTAEDEDIIICVCIIYIIFFMMYLLFFMYYCNSNKHFALCQTYKHFTKI